MLANVIFNNLKSPETGSIVKVLFLPTPTHRLIKLPKLVHLPNTFENWKTGGIYIKQTYYIGRIDTTSAKTRRIYYLPNG